MTFAIVGWVVVLASMVLLSVILLCVLPRDLPRDFREVHRRDRAMKVLKKGYDPFKDTVFDSKARRSGWWD